MADPLSLQIQNLGGFNEQVLVLLQAAELQRDDRFASPAQVAAIFRALRLPPPRNIAQHLSQLKGKELVMQPNPGQWSVTPRGKQEIGRLMSGLAPDDLSKLGGETVEPVFAGAAHHLIPPSFAPTLFQEGISRLLDGNPFDLNVFCMSRYPENGADPVSRAIETCRSVCTEVGLELHIAGERMVEDLLFGNVGTYMWASRYGIAIFEDRVQEGLSYNAVLEAGAMLATGRRCLLLKDRTSPSLPTDLVGHIYKPVDLDDPATLETAVRGWVVEDLNLSS